MDKQKQIEEMAKIMCGGCIDNELMTCGFTKEEIPCNFAKNFAETLYNAGYRKESETAGKFAKMLKEKLEENSHIAGYGLEDLEFDGDTIQECINETYNEIIKGEINGKILLDN